MHVYVGNILLYFGFFVGFIDFAVNVLLYHLCNDNVSYSLHSPLGAFSARPPVPLSDGLDTRPCEILVLLLGWVTVCGQVYHLSI